MQRGEPLKTIYYVGKNKNSITQHYYLVIVFILTPNNSIEYDGYVIFSILFTGEK